MMTNKFTDYPRKHQKQRDKLCQEVVVRGDLLHLERRGDKDIVSFVFWTPNQMLRRSILG